MPEKTREGLRAEGYFAPATWARWLPNGYLKLVGRANDLIITGGLNVYPAEIEEWINALPGVFESAVIGIPDADLGEAVTAVVVAHPGHALAGECPDRCSQGRDCRFQGAQTRAFRRRTAAQRDGQGAKEPVARALFAAMTREGYSVSRGFPQHERGYRHEQAGKYTSQLGNRQAVRDPDTERG